MAAAGGDTIVPTNWGGLILTAVIIAVVAAGTYFGMESMFGHQGGVEQKDELTVQEVFSASATRGVEAVEPARVLSRAELSASSSDDSSWDSESADAGMDASEEDDWDSAAVDDNGEDWDSTGDDWDTASSDDWDAEPSAQSTDDMNDMSAEIEAVEDAVETAVDSYEEDISSTYESAQEVANDIASAAESAMDDARNALTAPSGPVRQRPSADALRDWWSEGSGDLAVRFAGTLDRGNRVSDGIAVMFSEPVSPSQAAQHMQLSSSDGGSVSANWKTARNPNMLIVDGLSTGRYELMIKQSLASESGTTLTKTINGPVFVY